MTCGDGKSGDEIARLRAEYARRDAEGLSRIYMYAYPAFAFHMQEREWAILRILKESNVNLSGARLLEVGCGTGHILHRFLEFGAGKAFGIDLADHRLRIAKEEYPRLLLLHGNAAELPFADHSFDMVMQFMCLSSVIDPETRNRIAEEMWRVVRPGGMILYYDLRPLSLTMKLLLVLITSCRKAFRRRMISPKNGTAEADSPPTPIHPLGSEQIRDHFPMGDISCRSTSLEFTLAGIADYSLLGAQLLSRISLLHSHYLALIGKPEMNT